MIQSARAAVPKHHRLEGVCLLSHGSQLCPTLCETPWPVAFRASPSMGCSGQEYWSGLPFSPSGDLPDPGIEPMSPALQADSLPASHLGSPKYLLQLLEIRTYSPTFVLYTNLYKHFPLFFIKSPTWKNSNFCSKNSLPKVIVQINLDHSVIL